MTIDTGVRYIIVDKETELFDWDMQLHKSVDECLASLCGPHQPYVRTASEVDQDHDLWSDYYEIRRVLPVKARR